VTSGIIDEQLVWLCESAVQMTGVSCCGVTMVTSGGQSVTAHASDELARVVEDLQHTLGEGPGVATSASGAAVIAPDLEDLHDPGVAQWTTFAKDAVELGIRAAFTFPLLLGTSSLGAFSLYRLESGELGSEGALHGWVTAEAVARTLAGSGETVPGSIENLDPMRVHQAAGMVVVQLGVPIDQALLRMRGTAYSEGVSVDELAETIVQRRRRLSWEDT
jgi:hypothetical protein